MHHLSGTTLDQDDHMAASSYQLHCYCTIFIPSTKKNLHENISSGSVLCAIFTYEMVIDSTCIYKTHLERCQDDVIKKMPQAAYG
jgi:hypothetical protein